MNKFKFGDRVNHWRYGIGIVVHCEKNIAEVVFSDLSYRNAVDINDIKLIPHPDTARLDWLQSAYLEDKDNCVEYDFGHFVVRNEGFLELGLPFDTIREAIDTAIQTEKPA